MTDKQKQYKKHSNMNWIITSLVTLTIIGTGLPHRTALLRQPYWNICWILACLTNI